MTEYQKDQLQHLDDDMFTPYEDSRQFQMILNKPRQQKVVRKDPRNFDDYNLIHMLNNPKI